jgi:hypothetical protein
MSTIQLSLPIDQLTTYLSILSTQLVQPIFSFIIFEDKHFIYQLPFMALLGVCI